MSKTSYINEALSQDGKISYNVDNVSFKTNSVTALLQNLAWQYTDTYLGTVKSVKFEKETEFKARGIQELGINGTPLIFRNLTDEVISFKIGAENEIKMLHMTYLFVDKEDLMNLVNPNHVEFMVMLVNGIWFFLNRGENPEFFDMFEEISNANYVNTDLPKLLLPKKVPMIDSVAAAKQKLNFFGKTSGTSDYAVSSFTPQDDIEIKALPSMSKYASFAPDMNEFSQVEVNVHLKAGKEVPYFVDSNSKRLIFMSDDFGNNKWFLISDQNYVNTIMFGHIDFFVNSVSDALNSAEMNKGVKIDSIYESVEKFRAVSLFNDVQESFDYSGYFFVTGGTRLIRNGHYNQLSINKNNYVTKVHTTKDLPLFNDTIVTYSVNLKTGIVVLGFPRDQGNIYVTPLDETCTPELYNELLIGNAKTDVVVSISDIFYTDSAKK